MQLSWMWQQGCGGRLGLARGGSQPPGRSRPKALSQRKRAGFFPGRGWRFSPKRFTSLIKSPRDTENYKEIKRRRRREARDARVGGRRRLKGYDHLEPERGRTLREEPRRVAPTAKSGVRGYGRVEFQSKIFLSFTFALPSSVLRSRRLRLSITNCRSRKLIARLVGELFGVAVWVHGRQFWRNWA